MRSDYESWLRDQQYGAGTIANQLHRVRKVEEAYGPLDDQIQTGAIAAVIAELNYGTADERRNRPNPSRMVFQGNIRNNLQSYKNAVVRHQKFASGWARSIDGDAPAIISDAVTAAIDGEATALRAFSLERDMQRALRDDIESLGSGLRIVDEGMERAVDSGLIDVTCEDSEDGALVVVELKAGKADGRAVAQILGYMGDLSDEEAPKSVRGILIAHDFDQRARSAAKMVPTLQLLVYSIRFDFKPAVIQ
jgi:hypothetical protein